MGFAFDAHGEVCLAGDDIFTAVKLHPLGDKDTVDAGAVGAAEVLDVECGRFQLQAEVDARHAPITGKGEVRPFGAADFQGLIRHEDESFGPGRAGHSFDDDTHSSVPAQAAAGFRIRVEDLPAGQASRLHHPHAR